MFRCSRNPLAVALACFLLSGRKAGADATAVPAAVLDPGKIYVDRLCHIRATGLGGKTPVNRAFYDSGICSVGFEHFSEREETTIIGGKRRHTMVLVGEHTFLLHNPTSQATTFVLTHLLHKGWQVDSDPAPNETNGKTATFYVVAGPGQTVELHVGERNPPAP